MYFLVVNYSSLPKRSQRSVILLCTTISRDIPMRKHQRSQDPMHSASLRLPYLIISGDGNMQLYHSNFFRQLVILLDQLLLHLGSLLPSIFSSKTFWIHPSYFLIKNLLESSFVFSHPKPSGIILFLCLPRIYSTYMCAVVPCIA